MVNGLACVAPSDQGLHDSTVTTSSHPGSQDTTGTSAFLASPETWSTADDNPLSGQCGGGPRSIECEPGQYAVIRRPLQLGR
jgi:hypothetical protein